MHGMLHPISASPVPPHANPISVCTMGAVLPATEVVVSVLMLTVTLTVSARATDAPTNRNTNAVSTEVQLTLFEEHLCI